MAATTVKPPRNRSLKYEDHKALIHRQARKYFARLLAAQILSVDYEDVVSELSIPFVKATQGYNPDAGWTFTAYLGMCMQNHFNKFAKKLMLEQFGDESAEPGDKKYQGLGYVSIEDLKSADADSDSDPWELLCMESESATPEERVEAAMLLRSITNDSTLSVETRVYINLLADPTRTVSEAIRQRIRSTTGLIREEIADRYGVKMTFVRV